VLALPDPRLLFIAFFFPPTRASGVYRARAMANHFAAAGWDVTVVTAQREFFRDYLHSYDSTLETTVDPRITVDRVPIRMWHLEPDLRRYGIFRANFPMLAAKWRLAMDQWFFPEPYSPWIPRVVRRCLRLDRDAPFDVVLATGNPYSSFAAARMIARLTRIPYVLDYRDAWTVNQYTLRRPKRQARRRERHERALLRHASLVSFVNPAQRDWHATRYPPVAERMIVVENGWEPELLGNIPAAPAGANRPLVFSYLGTITTYLPLPIFFQGWRLCRQEPALAGSVVRMHGHLGFMRTGVAAVRALLPLSDGVGVEYAGPVPKTEVGRIYAEADVLLLILPGSGMVTGGKVYEYMATGKPIVSVHDPDSSASTTLSGYPLWFPAAAMTPEAIRDAVLRAAAAARYLRPESVAAAKRYAQRYSRDAQLRPFEARLRALARPFVDPSVAALPDHVQVEPR
jgi:glycosyltransferase involved in cell wall biosynthesis